MLVRFDFEHKKIPLPSDDSKGILLCKALLHKPTVLGIPLQGPTDSCNQLRCIQRPVKEGVDVAGFVGSRKEVVDLPQINLGIVPS